MIAKFLSLLLSFSHLAMGWAGASSQAKFLLEVGHTDCLCAVHVYSFSELAMAWNIGQLLFFLFLLDKRPQLLGL
jgi:hypothetical protein